MDVTINEVEYRAIRDAVLAIEARQAMIRNAYITTVGADAVIGAQFNSAEQYNSADSRPKEPGVYSVASEPFIIRTAHWNGFDWGVVSGKGRTPLINQDVCWRAVK